MKQTWTLNLNEISSVFHQIPERSYLERIMFFERHKNWIAQLSIISRIEIQCDYIIALFETGQYQRFLDKVDQTLESVIKENIRLYKEEDIFVELLFKKAAALFNLDKTTAACDILIQVIKIDHAHPYAALFLKKCLHQRARKNTNTYTAIFIATLILTALLTAFELIWLEAFFPKLEPLLQAFRNTAFLLGFIGITFIEAFKILSIRMQTKVYVKSSKEKAGTT